MPPDEPTTAYRTDDYSHESPNSVDLAIRVFRPAGPGPFPSLLQRTPYGRPETPAGRGVAVRALDAGPYDRRAVDRRDDVCTYTTPPADATTLAGPVRANLTVTTDAPDTDVVATLSHVTSEGVYPLASGIRRARYRHGRDREAAVPDGPIRLPVDMWDSHYRVPAGDRLRLSVASSDAPRFDPHPGPVRPWEATSDDVRTAEQTLHHADRESTLVVTVYDPVRRIATRHGPINRMLRYGM